MSLCTNQMHRRQDEFTGLSPRPPYLQQIIPQSELIVFSQAAAYDLQCIQPSYRRHSAVDVVIVFNDVQKHLSNVTTLMQGKK